MGDFTKTQAEAGRARRVFTRHLSECRRCGSFYSGGGIGDPCAQGRAAAEYLAKCDERHAAAVERQVAEMNEGCPRRG